MQTTSKRQPNEFLAFQYTAEREKEILEYFNSQEINGRNNVPFATTNGCRLRIVTETQVLLFETTDWILIDHIGNIFHRDDFDYRRHFDIPE